MAHKRSHLMKPPERNNSDFVTISTSSGTAIGTTSPHAGLEDPLNSLIRDIKIGTDGSDGRKSNETPIGVKSLYHEATAGIDTPLQFQWIRLHPSVAYSLCDHKESDTSGYASPSFTNNQSQKRKRESGGENDLWHSQDQKMSHTEGDEIMTTITPNGYYDESHPLHEPLCSLSGFNVTLTDILPPAPLLIEYVPGFDDDYQYHHNNSFDSNESQSSPLAHPPISESASSPVTILANAVRAAVHDNTTPGTTLAMTPSLAVKNALMPLRTTNERQRHTLLPPHSLHAALDGTQRDSVILQRIIALRWLSAVVSTEGMGSYILKHLCPLLLRDEGRWKLKEGDGGGTSEGNANEWRLEEGLEREMRLLANSVIRDCGLGRWSRRELNAVLLAGEAVIVTDEDDDAMDEKSEDDYAALWGEFSSMVGEAYFELRESVCA